MWISLNRRYANMPHQLPEWTRERDEKQIYAKCGDVFLHLCRTNFCVSIAFFECESAQDAICMVQNSFGMHARRHRASLTARQHTYNDR
jgi:hypothetical protein